MALETGPFFCLNIIILFSLAKRRSYQDDLRAFDARLTDVFDGRVCIRLIDVILRAFEGILARMFERI